MVPYLFYKYDLHIDGDFLKYEIKRNDIENDL
jgi:hypothetical protein